MTSDAPRLRYAGTGATLLRSSGWTLLLAVQQHDPLVARCWESLQTADDPDDVLDAILAQGLRSTGAFALVRELDAPRLVAHGELVVLVDGRDAVAGRPPGGWLDLPLDLSTATEVRLTDAVPLGPAGLPLRDGAVVAAGFVLTAGDGLVARGTRQAGGQPPAREAPAALADPSPARQTASGPAPESSDQDFSHLFAETRAPRAATGPADQDATAPRSTDTLLGAFTTGWADPDAQGGAASSEAHEMVVSREQLMRGRDAIEAPLVLAATCPAGHLTSAYGSFCRVCRMPVPPQEFVETLRPPLGRLVLPQGDFVLLDRGVVLGRSPWVPVDWAGAQPHLVALHDPDHDISAQHLAVTLDQWNVLVTDQGSTNGTTVIDPRGVERRLRPHEVQEIEVGSTIVLAEVLALVLEVEQ